MEKGKKNELRFYTMKIYIHTDIPLELMPEFAEVIIVARRLN